MHKIRIIIYNSILFLHPNRLYLKIFHSQHITARKKLTSEARIFSASHPSSRPSDYTYLTLQAASTLAIVLTQPEALRHSCVPLLYLLLPLFLSLLSSRCCMCAENWYINRRAHAIPALKGRALNGLSFLSLKVSAVHARACAH